MIESIADIQQLVRDGFDDWKQYGEVKVTPHDDGELLIFNYTNKAQYEARWNFFERVSRGLILNSTTGEIVARPFDKFFNWGEGDRTTTAAIVSIDEKLDGSLGILYRHKGKPCIATRGSFESDQAKWATKTLRKYWCDIADGGLTLLFEIIYSENRIVLDYRGQEGLALIGARHRESGEMIIGDELVRLAKHLRLSTGERFSMSLDDLLDQQEKQTGVEGWVVHFEDGSIFKFKTVEYLRIHKLISGLSFKRVLESIQNGEVDQMFEEIPDEFLDEAKEWRTYINARFLYHESAVHNMFAIAPQGTRKEFALWVMENAKAYKNMLFARMDNKNFGHLIYKTILENWKEEGLNDE